MRASAAHRGNRRPDWWSEFLARDRTYANRPRDFSGWHRGRNRYGVWVIELDSRAIAVRTRKLAAALSRYLIAGYRRQPHVTVFAAGFPCTWPSIPGDIAWAEVQAQARALRHEGPGPFTLRVGPLASLHGAPCLPAEPVAPLLQLRRVIEGFRREERSVPYRPHLTIGLYAGAYRTAKLARRLRRMGQQHRSVSIRVDSISFMTFDTRSIRGTLRRELSIPLGETRG